MQHIQQCIRIVGLSVGILASQLALADSITLGMAQKEALEHSPEIEKVQSELRESSAKKTESLSGFLPKLDLVGEHVFGYKFENEYLGAEQVDLDFPLSELGVRLKMPLFDGFRNVHEYKAESHLHEATEHKRDWTLFRIRQQIRSAFNQALAAQKLEEVAKEDVKTLQDHLNQVQNLLAGGAATNFDILRVQVQLQDAQSNLMQASDSVHLTKRQLMQTIGYADDDRSLAGDLPIPLDGLAAKIAAIDIKKVPVRDDTESLRETREGRNAIADATNGHWMPTVDLVAGFATYNNSSESLNVSNEFRQTYRVGVEFTWNIFDGMKDVSKHQEAVEQSIQAEKSLDRAVLTQAYDLDQWQRRYIYNADLYRARSANLKRAEESLRLANAGLTGGSRTSTDVLDAELDLFRARAGVVTAQVSTEEALVQLELSLGRNIE